MKRWLVIQKPCPYRCKILIMLFCGLVEQRHRITAILISKQIDVRKYKSKCKQGCNWSTLPINFLFWKENHVLTGKTCYFFTSINSRTLLVSLRSTNKIPRVNFGKKVTLFYQLINSYSKCLYYRKFQILQKNVFQ